MILAPPRHAPGAVTEAVQPGVAGLPTAARERYLAAVAHLQQCYHELPPGAGVRLAKSTSNLFRTRTPATGRLDAREFRGVLAVDPVGRTADVGGLTTYEELVAALLPHGLMPLVVPQLKTITLGGAVTGMGVESTSFRHGAPHESVVELDVLTGDGAVVTARCGGEHDALFHGFPNSYGTLGYALRLRIACQPVAPYVTLRHHALTSTAELAERLAGAASDPGVDFLDGVVFSPQESYITEGRFSTEPGTTSDYTHRGVYYRSVASRTEDRLRVADYLWRWDTDWFWCSRTFGVQRPWVRALLGPQRLRSENYWRLVAWENRYRVKARWDARRGQPDREAVIQDIEVPVQRLAEFLAFLDAQTGIRPVWVCPMRVRDASAWWPLYPMPVGELWVNVGFWSTVALPAGQGAGYHNRRIEAEVARLGGMKSLYSTSYYTREDFDRRYGGEVYRQLKDRYDPQGRLLDLYAKTVQGR